MNRFFVPVWVVLLALAASFVGCAKKAEAPVARAPVAPKPVAVDLVKESERSRSFLAVNRHLELGGTLYGYVDVDGDVLKVAGSLQGLAKQLATVQPAAAMVANQDFAAIATKLGVNDVKAVGLSSVRDDTGFFRNQVFFYTPGDRHGLLLGLGGKPGPLAHTNLAPADTAFYAESEIDVPVVYKTLRDVVAQVAGEQASGQLEASLKKAGENLSLSILDLIHGLKGRVAIVARVDAAHSFKTGPNGVTLPSFSLLVCVDSVGTILEPTLAKSPALKRTDDGTLHIYQLAHPSPIPELQPVIVIEGQTLYVATTRAYLDECRSGKPGLAQNPEFQKALASVGAESNGLTYVHPRLFDELRKFNSLNPSLPPQSRLIADNILAKLPRIDRPIVAIRTNLPDGILVRAYWDRSLKQDIAVLALYNPVSVGLMAAMAIPAFQKVRMASQEKAVLNNLRQLSAAADQYYLEHGVDAATYEQLVGPQKEKYIRNMISVCGEDYSALSFKQGEPLAVRLPDGRVVRFGP